MRQSDQARALAETLQIVDRLARRLPDLHRAFYEFEGVGLGSGDYEVGRVAGGGATSSHPERAALAPADTATRARAATARDIAQLHATARLLDRRLTYWLDPPSRLGAGEGDQGCTLCHACGSYQPATVTTAGNRLDHPHLLCRWHTDFARTTGRLATRAETERHLEGRRVRRTRNGRTVVTGIDRHLTLAGVA